MAQSGIMIGDYKGWTWEAGFADTWEYAEVKGQLEEFKITTQHMDIISANLYASIMEYLLF